MGINKSRPHYEKLRIDPRGRAHLIVSDLATVPEAADFAFPDIEIWVVGTAGFASVADLLSQLPLRLAREPVGLRLYALGSEAFLWDVNNLARQAGLGEAEIFLAQAGTSNRRVYCTHCKAMNEQVATNIVACEACGANLFVRDHFSRRLAAFMGVQVDAEVPGEIPALEILYP